MYSSSSRGLSIAFMPLLPSCILIPPYPSFHHTPPYLIPLLTSYPSLPHTPPYLIPPLSLIPLLPLYPSFPHTPPSLIHPLSPILSFPHTLLPSYPFLPSYPSFPFFPHPLPRPAPLYNVLCWVGFVAGKEIQWHHIPVHNRDIGRC